MSASILRKISPAALEPIAGGKNRSSDSFESKMENKTFDAIPKGAITEDSNHERQNPGDKQVSSLSNAFLIELVHSIKKALSSVYKASLLSVEKFDDVDTRKRSHNRIRNEIRNIDSVLNSLLNFISINTPIAKRNGLYVILEEILEANDKYLREKNIKIVKKCEQDLPDTSIHNEQVRFILHSVLQYAIFSTPRNETVGFLLKTLDSNKDSDARTDAPDRKKGYVEVVVGFNGELTGPLGNLLKRPEDQRQSTDLILILVNELLTRNRGSMTIASNGKGPKTLLTLRFPIERRNAVYYAPITL